MIFAKPVRLLNFPHVYVNQLRKDMSCEDFPDVHARSTNISIIIIALLLDTHLMGFHYCSNTLFVVDILISILGNTIVFIFISYICIFSALTCIQINCVPTGDFPGGVYVLYLFSSHIITSEWAK